MTRATRHSRSRAVSGIAHLAIAGALLFGGCKNLDIPDYQAGSIDDLTKGTPTATAVATAAQGLPIGTRAIQTGGAFGGGLVITFGVIGREGLVLNPTSGSALAPYFEAIDRSLGSGVWSSTYAGLRQATIVLKALDNVIGMTDADKEGIRGWTKTLMAYDLLLVIDVMDQSGAAIDVDRAIDDPLPAIVSKDQVFARIVLLLDQAKVHLQNAGTKLAFTPPKGFASFSTPAGLIMVNRAIRARVDVYMGNWAAALQSISESFIDANATLTLGAYNTYGSASADQVNPLYDPVPRTLYAYPTTITDARLRLDNTPDLRATTKTLPTPPLAYAGVTGTLKWNIYKAPDDGDPIIRNEELFLLRAEANFQLNNRVLALQDINFIRTTSGGLPAIADPGDPGMLDEILYNRRYSLLWEGAHRWIDARRYDRLLQLPRARVGDKIFPYSPLPDAECLPRSPQPPGCAIPAAL